MTARTFGIRFSLCYALLMIGSGVQLPFLPLWLHAKGFGASEIAAVVAGMMAVRMVGAPLFAFVADRTGNRRLVIQLCAIVALLAYFGLPFTNDFTQVLLVGLIASLFFAPVFPLIEGFSVDVSTIHGLDYGRMRLWASLSFLTGSLISGALLTWLPASDTVWLIAGAQIFTVVAAFVLPAEPYSSKSKLQTNKMELKAALKFLLGSRFTVFLMAACLANSSHAMLYGFSSVHWTSLGFNTMTIGLFWAIGVMAEVALFGFSNRVVHKLGVQRLLCVGLAGGIVRWVGMGLVTSEVLTGLLQLLHALSFACCHLALMHFIRMNVPHDLRNTAQGLYAALAGGVLLSSVTWASGPLFSAYGGHAYFAMAGICALGLAIAVYYMRTIPKAHVVVAA